MSDKKQQKPLTLSEYMSAFVLAFMAAFLWLQSLNLALFWATVATLLFAFFGSESLAGVRTAVWRGIVVVSIPPIEDSVTAVPPFPAAVAFLLSPRFHPPGRGLFYFLLASL